MGSAAECTANIVTHGPAPQTQLRPLSSLSGASTMTLPPQVTHATTHEHSDRTTPTEACKHESASSEPSARNLMMQQVCSDKPREAENSSQQSSSDSQIQPWSSLPPQVAQHIDQARSLGTPWHYNFSARVQAHEQTHQSTIRHLCMHTASARHRKRRNNHISSLIARVVIRA